MSAVQAEKRRVTHVFHPEPAHDLLHLGQGIHARVAVGEPSYQLDSGETVAL